MALALLALSVASQAQEGNMRIRRVVVVVLAAVVLVGCAGSREDLIDSGYVSLDRPPSGPLLRPPTVTSLNGNLVVTGTIDTSETDSGGHIDVSVVAPDNTVVYQAMVSYRRSSAAYSKGPRGQPVGARSAPESRATYSVEFPGLPPQGSIVKVRYDAHAHEKTP